MQWGKCVTAWDLKTNKYPRGGDFEFGSNESPGSPVGRGWLKRHLRRARLVPGEGKRFKTVFFPFLPHALCFGRDINK